MSIPKILHYVWVGPQPLPESHARYIEGWRRVMPDWQIMAWTDADVDWSVRYLQQAYATRGWNRISNYLRARALHEHGGFYLDTDVELLRPLDPLVEEDAVLGFQRVEPCSSWVNGAVFGARRGHGFTTRLIEAYEREMPGWRRMGDSHGPGLITRLLRDAGLKTYTPEPQRVAGVTLGPVEWFYPRPLGDRYQPELIGPGSFAVHHWYGTVGTFRPLTKRQKLRVACAVVAPRVTAGIVRREVEAERLALGAPRPAAAATTAASPVSGTPRHVAAKAPA
jgi:hypothetical protein